MTKDELITNLFSKRTDDEKLDLLRKYGDIKLYKYQRYAGTKDSNKLSTLQKRKFWLSRPDCFDDDFEGTIIKAGRKDVSTILELQNRSNLQAMQTELSSGKAGKVVNDTYPNKKVEISYILQNGINFSRKQKRELQKPQNALKLISDFDKMMREYRKNFVIACFSENSPVDAKNNMWQQYCSDENGQNVSGFCLEYTLSDFLEKKMIISPVYYKDNTSITTLCKKFDYHVETIFIHKHQFGYDSKKDPLKEHRISWENQNEWRIVTFADNPENAGNESAFQLIPRKAYYLDTMPDKDIFISILESGDKTIEPHEVKVNNLK